MFPKMFLIYLPSTCKGEMVIITPEFVIVTLLVNIDSPYESVIAAKTTDINANANNFSLDNSPIPPHCLSKSKEIVLILKICYNKGDIFIKGAHVLFHKYTKVFYIISLTIFDFFLRCYRNEKQ
jgi:hypothetical protein